MLLSIFFRCLEFPVNFFSCDPQNLPVFSPPVYVQLYSKFWLLALFCISLKRLHRIFYKPHHIIFTRYIIMFETFIKIDSLPLLEISRRT